MSIYSITPRQLKKCCNY